MAQLSAPPPISEEEYSVPAHAYAAVLLLLVSAAGSFLPLLVNGPPPSIGDAPLTSQLPGRAPRPAAQLAVRLGTYFGFGTILSTALVHMLPPAAAKLGTAGDADSGPALAGAAAVAAILGMQLLDAAVESAHADPAAPRGLLLSAHRHSSPRADSSVGRGGGLRRPLLAHAGSSELGDAETAGTGDRGAGGEAPSLRAQPSQASGPSAAMLCVAVPSRPLCSRALGIYAVEAGVVMHSVLVGASLSVSSGAAFPPLLAALSFHQFFEGFAVGSAALDAALPPRVFCALGALFSATAPAGVLAGMTLRGVYDDRPELAKIVEGVVDAMAGGVLLYVVLVQLLAPMMTHSPWLHALPARHRGLCFAALYLGAGAMALLGLWA